MLRYWKLTWARKSWPCSQSGHLSEAPGLQLQRGQNWSALWVRAAPQQLRHSILQRPPHYHGSQDDAPGEPEQLQGGLLGSWPTELGHLLALVMQTGRVSVYRPQTAAQAHLGTGDIPTAAVEALGQRQ